MKHRIKLTAWSALAITALLAGCDNPTANPEKAYLENIWHDEHLFITERRSTSKAALVHHPDCPCFSR